jgi:hypothetical protein
MFRLLLFSLFVPYFFFSQVTPKLVEEFKMDIQSSSTFDVDALGNLYVGNFQLLQKYNSNNQLLFQQSIKSIGAISGIDARNPLKIILFSKEQQTISIFDNNLNLQNQLDLSEYGIKNATCFSASDQPSKFWIYDQPNSTLCMIDLRTNQTQRIQNMHQLIGSSEIIQLQEHENYLYIVDAQKGVYQLDFFGSLVTTYPITTSCISIEKNILYVYFDNKLSIYSNQTSTPVDIITSIQPNEIKAVDNFIYLKSSNQLIKYSLLK